MLTLFLADFIVFFVINTASFSFYFSFPDLHICSFTLPEVAMTENLIICFLNHHQATQLFSLTSELQVPDFKMRQWSLWDDNRKQCREGGPWTSTFYSLGISWSYLVCPQVQMTLRGFFLLFPTPTPFLLSSLQLRAAHVRASDLTDRNVDYE